MKTKEFMRRVEDELGYIAHKSESYVTITNKYDDAFAIVDLRKTFGIDTTFPVFRKLDKHNRSLLFNLILEYARTPLEEREEEKKYRYKFKPSIKSGGGGEDKVFHLARFLFREDLKLDASGSGHAKSSESFHFTDKEVEEFTDEQKLLIQLCEKIEVTP